MPEKVRFPRMSFLLVCLLASSLGPRPAVSDPGISKPVVMDRLEASVNATLILKSDISKFRETVKLRSQLDPLFAGTPLAEKGDHASDKEIVEFLIHEKLILNQFPVTDAEAEQEINSIQSNNKIDRAALKNALSQQGFPFTDYFELIRMSAGKRNLIDRDIRTKVTISQDDIKNYYFNHSSRTSAISINYHLQLISVSPASYKTPAAAKETALQALKAIRSGERFEEVAKRLSDHPSSSSGGDLGFVTDDQMSPQIREQVKKLQIGQVSDVFGTFQSGFFILKLADFESNDKDRFEKMKDQISAKLTAAEYQHQVSLWLERQSQNSFIHRAGEPAMAGLPVFQR